MNVWDVNFSSNRNHSNLHSVEQCFQRWMNEETGRRQFPFAIWNRTRHNWKERKAY
ncbi:hypothetical protein T03_7531, partial [Trichinella britovi]